MRSWAAALERRRERLITSVVVTSAVIALLATAIPSSASAAAFSATIRRTEGGIPHITAPNYAGLGYGYGYAFAQDNICVMAEDYIRVDAERSGFFGPAGSYQQRGSGVNPNNLASDFFYQQIIAPHVIDELLAKEPPLGPAQEVRDLARGYVAGYNRYLSDVGGTNGVPDSSCRGKPWVRPITEADAYRRFYQLTELASGDVVIDGIPQAAPPAGPFDAPLDARAIAQGLSTRLPLKGAGSNAVAIGSAGHGTPKR